MTYDQKVKLLERFYSLSIPSDRNSIDYYIPKKGDSRFDKSVEGGEILVSTVGASSSPTLVVTMVITLRLKMRRVM